EAADACRATMASTVGPEMADVVFRAISARCAKARTSGSSQGPPTPTRGELCAPPRASRSAHEPLAGRSRRASKAHCEDDPRHRPTARATRPGSLEQAQTAAPDAAGQEHLDSPRGSHGTVA